MTIEYSVLNIEPSFFIDMKIEVNKFYHIFNGIYFQCSSMKKHEEEKI